MRRCLSPQAWKYRRRRGVNRAMQNAPFKFEPVDWFDFFKRHGWQTKDMRYFIDEAERLRRPFPGSPPLRLLMAASRLWLSPERRKVMSRFAGYALLERAA